MADTLQVAARQSPVENAVSGICEAPILQTSLPSELVTGHPIIDTEHGQLLLAMTGLRRVCDDVRRSDCSGCGMATQDKCESELIGLLGDLLAFILDHFSTEERIMRQSLLLMVDRDLCESHMEDHAAISSKVQQVVSRLDRKNTIGRIRELDQLLNQWIRNHIQLHDKLLARWLARDDNLLIK